MKDESKINKETKEIFKPGQRVVDVNRNIYGIRRRVQLFCEKESKTQQNFKEDTDVKNILEKYTRTGELPKFYKEPLYGDYSNVVDFQEAQNIIIKAKEQFEGLPSKIREKFSNSPEKFLEYMESDGNIREKVDLGLLGPEALPVPNTPEPVQEAAPEQKNGNKE